MNDGLKIAKTSLFIGFYCMSFFAFAQTDDHQTYHHDQATQKSKGHAHTKAYCDRIRQEHNRKLDGLLKSADTLSSFSNPRSHLMAVDYTQTTNTSSIREAVMAYQNQGN